MSWTDEEIDGLVKQAAGEVNVAYKEAYWTEMEAMLGEPAKRRRGIIWWWFGGAATLLLGYLIVHLATMANNETLTEQQYAQQSTQPEGSTDRASVQETTTAPVKLPEQNIQEVNSSQQGQLLESMDQGIRTVQQSDIQEVPKDQQIPTPDKHRNGVYSEETAKRISLKEREKNNFEKMDSGNPTGVVREIPGSLEQEPVSGDVLATDNVPVHEQIQVDALMVHDWQVARSGFYMASPDPMLPVFPGKRFGFYAAAYGGVGMSYVQAGKDNQLYQIGMDAGVEWFRNRWAFSAGFGLREQFVNNLDISRREEYYSYGLVSVDQALHYDRIVFVDLPVSASYLFGKSTFSIQLTPTYTAGARLAYSSEVREQVGQDNSISSSSSEKHQFVSSPNFAAFGVNGGVSYGYALFERVFLEAKVSSRLAPALLSDDFTGTKRQVPLMVEVGLKKRF